eukprot:363280-Chlamydomonas_euryale.AAC.4
MYTRIQLCTRNRRHLVAASRCGCAWLCLSGLVGPALGHCWIFAGSLLGFCNILAGQLLGFCWADFGLCRDLVGPLLAMNGPLWGPRCSEVRRRRWRGGGCGRWTGRGRCLASPGAEALARLHGCRPCQAAQSQVAGCCRGLHRLCCWGAGPGWSALSSASLAVVVAQDSHLTAKGTNVSSAT